MDRSGTGHLGGDLHSGARVAALLVALAVVGAGTASGSASARALAIAAGSDGTCALLSGASVACWGANGDGQLGDGLSAGPQRCDGDPCSATPVVVRGLTGATAIAAGGDDVCALGAGGSVACWGANGDGQLGVGVSDGPQRCDGDPCSAIPVVVRGVTGATAIAVGGDDVCAVVAGGSVACWGANGDGQLGVGVSDGPQRCDGDPCSATPVVVRGVTGATAIAAGGDDVCAVVAGGSVACWGANGDGQLGVGVSDGPQRCVGGPCSATPVVVRGVTGATAIAAGADHVCALVASGGVDCWGYNFSAELGVGTSSGPQSCATGQWCSTVAVAVIGIAGATALAAGGDHTCVITGDRAVECWGFNSFGQLGDGTSSGPQTCYWNLVRCAKAPVAVGAVAGAIALAAGGDHTCALLGGGGVDCWGANWFGELGDGAHGGPDLCNYYPCSASPVTVGAPVAASAGTRR